MNLNSYAHSIIRHSFVIRHWAFDIPFPFQTLDNSFAIRMREPCYAASAAVWSMAERGEIEACISAISFNNVYYVVRKWSGRKAAEQALRCLRDVFVPVAPDARILNQAMDSGMDDFEDAIQCFSAIRAGAAFLVTRNPTHFRTVRGGVPVLTPEEFLTVSQRKTHS